MDTFWRLFKESFIIQSLITLIVVITISIMYYQGRQVPPDLVNMTWLIVGFYFGGKVQGRLTK